MAKAEVEDAAPVAEPDVEMAAKTEEGDTEVSEELVEMHLDGQASVTPTPENFRETFLACGKAILQKHGDPLQYLQATVNDAKGFAETLRAKFPPSAVHD